MQSYPTFLHKNLQVKELLQTSEVKKVYLVMETQKNKLMVIKVYSANYLWLYEKEL